MSIIRQYTLNNQTNPVGMFLDRREKLDLDPPYQRGPVWGEERQRNLIKSLYMGLPIGAMVINRRRYPQDWTVIDGKQRILAIRAFADDQFSVPGAWFGADFDMEPGRDYTFSELGQKARRVFETGASISVYYADFNGIGALEREEELFELINFGGVPQGESDKA